MRALRGATTVDVDSREQVMDRTGELVTSLIDRNGVDHEDLVSIIFTATDDISSEFPAAAARAAGINTVPLLCARELSVVGAVERCIRVLIHAYTDRAPADLRHVYLHGAEPLRTDLPR